MAMMDINLRDIQVVELGGGRVQKIIGLRTPTHVVHVRTLGGAALAAAALIDPARRAFAREAGGGLGDLPRLLRGEPV